MGCETGIWLRDSSTNSKVIGNDIGGTASRGILVQTASTGAVIDENVISGHSLAGVQVVGSNGAKLAWNEADGCRIGILVQSSSLVEAANNTLLNGYRGMEINATSASIKDNILQGNSQAGIYLHTSSSSTLLRNNCSFNLDSGIIVVLGTNNKVLENSLFGNSLFGLKGVGETNLQISTNRLGGNEAAGIRLDSCAYPVLYNNILSNEAMGLRITGGSGAMVYQNQIIKASGSGIMLSSTSVVVVHDNLIQDCVGYAVDATSSSASRFYLNLMIHNNGTSSVPSPNNKQARDDSSNDDWSFSGRGNYWSDMTTPDDNRDGIVDSPYALAGKATDLKPLSGPLGPVTNADYKKGKTYVHLTWSAPNYTAYAPLTSYYIVRMNSTSTVPFTLAPGQTEYNDTSISSISDYTYDIRARSSIGSSVIISFDVPRSDVVKPTVEITNPVQGELLNNTLIVAAWTGSDPEPSSGIAKYEVSLDAGAWLDVGTNISYPLPNLDQGTHSFAVRATDREGNSNQSSVQFYVDAWSPVLVINLPQPGSIQNQSSVLVRWTGTDNGTSIKGYQFRVDGGAWSSLQTQNQTSLVMSPGAHIIYVRAFDSVDLISTTSTDLIIDPYAPVVTITSPSKTDLRNKNVHLAWNGTDNLTIITAFEVRVDSGPWIPMGLSSSYDLVLGEGGHSLFVRALDQAGNYGTAQLNVTVDLTGPQVEILRPAYGTYVNKRNVLIEWSVVSIGSPLAWSEVRLDGTLWVNVSTALTYTTPSLAEGSHLVEVQTYDQAGNSGVNSTTFQVDTVAPVVDWFYPSYGLILSTDYVVMLWNASDDRSGLNTTFVLVDSLDPLEIGLSTEFNVTSLAQGDHMIGVRVYDIAGNYGVGQVGIYVDLTPPKVTITYPLEGQIVQGREINVMWTASDVGSGLWYFYASGDGIGWLDLGYTFSHVFTGFSDGRHTIYIKAFDRAYNTNIGTVNFTVDFSQPVVAISYPVTGGWINSTSFEARWSGSDSPLGMDHYEVRLDGSNWTNVGLDTTFRFDGLNYSSHLLEVKGVSNSSQQTVARSTFGIDTFAPSPPTVVQPSLYVSNGRISFSWGASTDNSSGISGYQVRTSRTYFNGSAYATEIGPWTEVGTSLSYTSTGNLDGWYNASVRAKDRAGNIGPEGTIQLILDSVPPLALSYSPLGTSVSVSAAITVTFSEPMVTSSVRVYIGASGTISWEGDDFMRYTPAEPFPYNATYDVEVTGRDLAGNSMTPLLWQFRIQPNLGTVSGKVLDELNAPIQGALVSLENGQTATTDRDGEFEHYSTLGHAHPHYQLRGLLGHPCQRNIIGRGGNGYRSRSHGQGGDGLLLGDHPHLRSPSGGGDRAGLPAEEEEEVGGANGDDQDWSGSSSCGEGHRAPP